MLWYFSAVRNDRNKKKKPTKSESICPSPETDELTVDELSLLQEILEAHRVTYFQEELAPLSPLSFNSIKLVGLSEACKESKEKEKKNEPNFPNKVGNSTWVIVICWAINHSLKVSSKVDYSRSAMCKQCIVQTVGNVFEIWYFQNNYKVL